MPGCTGEGQVSLSPVLCTSNKFQVLRDQQVRSSCRCPMRSTVVVSPYEVKGTVRHKVASLRQPNLDDCVQEATCCTILVSFGSLYGSAAILPRGCCCRPLPRRRGQAVCQTPHLQECRELTGIAMYPFGVTPQITKHKTISPPLALTSGLVGKILYLVSSEVNSKHEV